MTVLRHSNYRSYMEEHYEMNTEKSLIIQSKRYLDTSSSSDSEATADMTQGSSFSCLDMDSPIARSPLYESFTDSLFQKTEDASPTRGEQPISKAQRLKEKRLAIEAWNEKRRLSSKQIRRSPAQPDQSSDQSSPENTRNAPIDSTRESSLLPKYERERTKRIIQRLTNAEIKLKVKQYELWARSKKQVCHRRYNETIIDWAETTLRLSQLRVAREFYERRLELNSQSEVPMATLKIVSTSQQFCRHTLKYELDHAVAMLGDLYPGDELQRMFGEIRLLKRSGIEQLALQVGDLTDFRLRANSGKWIDSSKLRSQGRLIVTFYHSCGSSLCMITLRALQKYQKTFESEGAKLVAISPESHESTKTSASKSGAKFPLVSDTNGQIAKAFGLTYQTEATLPGNLHPRLLPMTATYVIDTDGTSLYKFVNCDHTKRAEPTEILEALQMTESRMRRGLFSRIRGGPGS